MKITRRAILSATLLLTMLRPAVAQPVEIKFASPTPPKAHLNVQVFDPWTKEVTAASGGTLKVTLVTGPTLASHRNIYDRVRQGVADIGWGLQALVPGQFPGSSVVQLPGNFDHSVNASIALWRLFEKGLVSKEYNDIKVLAVFSVPPYSIHSNQPLNKVADLKGMKIAVNGKTGGDILVALGAAPISLAPPEYYQSMSRGLVNGIYLSWTGIPPYRLNEVTKYTLDAPLGGNAGMIIMNKAVYGKLPEQARKAIDKASGETLVRRFSTFWDRIQTESRTRLGLRPGHTIFTPKGSEKTEMLKSLSSVEQDWVKRTANGAALLAEFKAELQKLQDSK